MSARDADVLVIGGGPAGCAAAIRLVEAGHDVLILERRSEATDGAERIESGELLAPMTQVECQQLGVAFEGPWVLDRTTAVRNVYPDLSWTYHELPGGLFYQNVDGASTRAAKGSAPSAVASPGTSAWRRSTSAPTRSSSARPKGTSGARRS
jgi:choline dehydrogenase-like flavoprotein